MYKGKVCGLFASFLIISCMVLFGPLSGVSHASSVYDDVIISGGSATLTSKYKPGVGTCDDDNSFDAFGWAGIISDSTKYHPAYEAQAGDVASALDNAFNNGGGWWVNQWVTPDGSNPSLAGGALSTCSGDSWLQVLISDNKTATFQDNWGGKQVGMTGSWYAVTIFASNTSTSNEKQWLVTEVYHGTGNSVLAGYSLAQGYAPQKTVLSAFDLAYPEGYEGYKPPDNISISKKDKLQFGWSVDNTGTLTAVFLQNVKSDMLDHCGITWTLKESDSSWTNTGNTINSVTQEKSMTYDYKSLSPGFYKLTGQIGTCIPFIDDGKILASTVQIAYNGSFVGGTSDKGGNSSTPLAEQNAVINSYGFTEAIQAPLKAISRMVGSTCAPVTLPFINGSNIVLPCLSGLYKSSVPIFFSIWQVAITGAIMYWFAVNMLRHIKKLVRPNDDSIEVVQL